MLISFGDLISRMISSAVERNLHRHETRPFPAPSCEGISGGRGWLMRLQLCIDTSYVQALANSTRTYHPFYRSSVVRRAFTMAVFLDDASLASSMSLLEFSRL